jgi:hypothetical protein
MPNVDDTDLPSSELVKVDEEEEVVTLDEEDKKNVKKCLAINY